jgi:HEAT repeat protein
MRRFTLWLGLTAMVLVVAVVCNTFFGRASSDVPAAGLDASRHAVMSSGKAVEEATGFEVRAPPPTFADAAAAAAAVTSNTPAEPVLAAGSDQDIARLVLHFQDPAVAVAERLKELEALVRRGDAFTASVLECLGDKRTYLNYAAVEALGRVQEPGVADYLKGKLTDGDPRVLAAAVRSLAKQQGDAAVPSIAAVVKGNRQRPDGFQDTVCAACVQALADTKSPRAIPLLDAELRETVGTTLQYEYGSQVVQALVAIHDSAARPVLLAYADRLTAQEQKAGNNLMGQRYMQAKIKEARDAAEALPK